MGGDQFSRTLGSDSVDGIDQVEQSRVVDPISPMVGKKVERNKDVASEPEHGHRHHSRLIQPQPEQWNMVIEALELFNDHLDKRKLPFVVRIRAHDNGFRIHLIREEDGSLIKQTEIIPFSSMTRDDLDHIINSLICECGVVIDVMR